MDLDNADDIQMVMRAEKQSGSGIFNNQRLLVVKAGIVSYYSKIPKQFIGNVKSLELSGQLPKYSILASEIEKAYIDGKSIYLVFKKSRLLDKKEIDKLLNNKDSFQMKPVSNDQQLEKWIFKNQDKFLLEEFLRLVNYFRGAKSPFKTELIQAIDSYTPQRYSTQFFKGIRPTSFNMTQSNEKQYRMSEIPSPTKKKRRKEEIDAITSIIKLEEVSPKKVKKDANKKDLNIILENIEEKKDVDVEKSQSEISVGETKKKQKKQKKKKAEKEKSQKEKSQKQKDVDNQSTVKPIKVASQKLQNKQERVSTETMGSSQITQRSVENLQQIKELQKKTKSSIQVNIRQNEIIKKKIEKEIIVEKKIIPKKTVKVGENFLKELVLLNLRKKQTDENVWENNIYDYLFECVLEQSKKRDYYSQPLDKSTSPKKKPEPLDKYHTFPPRKKQIQFFEILKKSNQVKNQLYLQKEIQTLTKNESSKQEMIEIVRDVIKKAEIQNLGEDIVKVKQYSVHFKPISYASRTLLLLKGQILLTRDSLLEEFFVSYQLRKILASIRKKQERFDLHIKGFPLYLKYKGRQYLINETIDYNRYISYETIKKSKEILNTSTLQQFVKDYPKYEILIQELQSGSFRFALKKKKDAQGNMNYKKLKDEVLEYYQKYVSCCENTIFKYYGKTFQRDMISEVCLAAIREVSSQTGQLDIYNLENTMSQAKCNIHRYFISRITSCRIDSRRNLAFHNFILSSQDEAENVQNMVNRHLKREQLTQAKRIIDWQITCLSNRKQTPLSSYLRVYMKLIQIMHLQEEENNEEEINILEYILRCLKEWEIEVLEIYMRLMGVYCIQGNYEMIEKVVENCMIFLKRMFREESFVVYFQINRICGLLNLLNSKGTISNCIEANKKSMEALQEYSKENQNEVENVRFKSIIQTDLARLILLHNRVTESYGEIQKAVIMLSNANDTNSRIFMKTVIALTRIWMKFQAPTPNSLVMVEEYLEKALKLVNQQQEQNILVQVAWLAQQVVKKTREREIKCLLNGSEVVKSIEKHQIFKEEGILSYYVKDL